ncbi:MAG: hypothetical protein KME10_24430 [Plectolyngbya sp. WJT66-NPBG17]|jgi:hypothetical protein|nr:hypothetical protein [Plectolyngbya sp. WJT66-NPBG17]MBW4526931.1 hypothetical protein [Phormidium tanganyikae FI6-MK23]
MLERTYEQLSAIEGQEILERLPERIKNAIIARATEIDYQIEAILEMAIAGYLDPHAIGFADCKPGRRA